MPGLLVFVTPLPIMTNDKTGNRDRKPGGANTIISSPYKADLEASLSKIDNARKRNVLKSLKFSRKTKTSKRKVTVSWKYKSNTSLPSSSEPSNEKLNF